MKLLLPVSLALLFYVSLGQTQKTASPPAAQAGLDTASAELVTLTMAWTDAINAKDHAKLDALMAPEFALYAWKGEVWAHRSPWLDTLDQTEIKEYTVRDISPRVYGEFAVVTSVCTWAGIREGRSFDFHTILLDTWRRTNGKWQVVARNSCPVNSASASTASPCTR
jgi:ketosteroid isomerase-like protein